MDAIDIARKCFLAYVENDRATLETLIGNDFHFMSPLDNRIDRATYFERCWPNHETIKNFNFIRMVNSGEQVFVTYEGQSTSGSKFQNTEVLTIKGDKIVDVEVYFGWNIPHKATPGGFVDP